MKCKNCGVELNNTSSSEEYAVCNKCIIFTDGKVESWLDKKLKEHGDE